jgi:hypothetical protein
MKKLNLNLKSPCGLCPFRKDSMFGWLGFDRAEEIIECIAGSTHGSFTCHNTNEFGFDEDGESITIETDESEHCAGALILLNKAGRTNFAMRFGYMAGIYDPETYKNQDSVFDDLDEFVLHHGGIAPDEANKMHYCPDCESRCFCGPGQDDDFNCIHCEG